MSPSPMPSWIPNRMRPASTSVGASVEGGFESRLPDLDRVADPDRTSGHDGRVDAGILTTFAHDRAEDGRVLRQLVLRLDGHRATHDRHLDLHAHAAHLHL